MRTPILRLRARLDTLPSGILSDWTEKLPEGQRLAVRLQLQGLPVAEIAEHLHTTPAGVRSRLARARQLLNVLYDQAGVPR